MKNNTSDQARFHFSIIIPLEFHRGQVENCLRRWAQEQDYDRNAYEIIAVGCRHSLSKEICDFFKSLLGENDRLLLFDEPHDMALCAHGAMQANGEVLFFTESHCLPETNTLTLAKETLDRHPEWAGFSCFSEPVTHNKLSVVEADMYNIDILYGMNTHPWRKILDQCFIVWAAPYHTSQGFRPQFGHYAEWVLAAQMHNNGYRLGYAPHIKINHYYSGEIEELIEFTADFIRGEMTLHSNFYEDDFYHYFHAPDEWRMRYQWSPDLARSVLSLVSGNIKFFLRPDVFLNAWLHVYLGIQPAIQAASLRFWFARLALSAGGALPISKNLLHKLFLRLIDAVVRLERIRYIENWLKGNHLLGYTPAASFEWKLGQTYILPALGFHATETWQERPFCWVEPVGMFEVSLMPGKYSFTMEWLTFKPAKNLIIYLNEHLLPLQLEPGKVTSLPFEITTPNPVRFSWTCQPVLAPKDPRLLGIPVVAMQILPVVVPK
jgi:hypothetical protein